MSERMIEDQISEQIEELEYLQEVLLRLSATRARYRVSLSTNILVIRIGEQQFGDAMQTLRRDLEGWRYRLKDMFYVTGDKMIATYIDDNYPGVEVWMSFSRTNPPPELLEKCRIEQQRYITYEVVCDA